MKIIRQGLIGFYSESDVLNLREGKATIAFKFVCDSKHHRNGSDAFQWVMSLISTHFPPLTKDSV